MQKPIILLMAIALNLIIAAPVYADIVLDDSFNDTAQVDLVRTTASVDTSNHCVQLPGRSLASSVDMLEKGRGYAVAAQNGITLYELDDATGKIAASPVYSISWATDATGVSMRQDNLNMWVISESSVAYYKYSGSGMSNDPELKTTGLNGVLSVAAFKNSDSALVLQADGNRARITRYDAGGNLNPHLVFEPGVTDPVAVSMVGNSPDFRLFTKDTAYYYSYDDSGGTYVEDPARRIAGLSNTMAASSDSLGNSILGGSGAGYYMNNDSGGAARVEVFSPGPVGSPVAVSLKPGSYEQALIDESGNVQWWTYDDAAGKMVRDASLEVSGGQLNSGYAHPKAYYSKVECAPENCDAAYLTVNDDRPEGTLVNYYLSSDGGNTFTSITPGAWTAVPGGDLFVLRADLDTADSQKTPQIYRVALNCDADFTLSGYIDPQPAERGRNVTISAAAAKLTDGTPVLLDSCTVLYPMPYMADGAPALPAGDLSATAAMEFNCGTGRWEYNFTMPEKTAGSLWPDDGVYLVQIKGVKDGVAKYINLNLEIRGNILRRLVIRTMNL